MTDHGKMGRLVGGTLGGEMATVALIVALGVSGWAQEGESATPASQGIDRKWVEKQQGKAGFYLRLPEQQRAENPDFYLSHPLVDAAIVTFKWKHLEPSPGQYDFSDIDRTLDLCKKHNKGLVMGFSTYGQTPDDQPTPDWLYEKGVRKITFNGGGVAKGSEIDVPKAWDETYFAEYEKLIQALGARYNGVPGIWSVRPAFGHIGNVNAQPSKGGGPAFLAEGWTPEIWTALCLRVTQAFQSAFPDTPLIALSAKQLLKDKEHDDYAKEANEILEKLAKRRVSIISFGLEPEVEPLVKNNIIGRLAALAPYALRGEIRLGVGDDWPLWVPEDRRQKQDFLTHRDEAGLARELTYAFGGVEGLPESHVSVMFVLHPEIEASHPDLGPQQNKKVYDILAAARERLKQEDPIAALLK